MTLIFHQTSLQTDKWLLGQIGDYGLRVAIAFNLGMQRGWWYLQHYKLAHKTLIALAVSEDHTTFTVISNGVSTQQVTTIMQFIDPIRLFITTPMYHKKNLSLFSLLHSNVLNYSLWKHYQIVLSKTFGTEYLSSGYIIHNLIRDLCFLTICHDVKNKCVYIDTS